MSESAIEDGMTPLAYGHASAQVHGQRATHAPGAGGAPVRPGEGEPHHPSGPVDWRGMLDDDYVATFGALTDFLAWAVPHWRFTTDEFPYGCWWLHGDVIEEMTAWWTMWQAYIRNPIAHPADPAVFHERTWNLKQRLGATYRGRSRQQHQPPASCPAVARPSPPASA